MFVVKRVLIGTALVGIGAIIGYFVARKALEDQYRNDVTEIRDLYQKKLEELESMIEMVESPEDPDDVGVDDGVGDEDEETDAGEEDEPDDEEAEEAKAALATYRGQRRPSAVEYNKPPLTTLKRVREANRGLHDDVSVVVGVNGEENLGNIDDEESDYRPSNDPEYEAELEKMAEDYALRRTENMKSERPYLIEPEEYQEGPEDYDHQALYYYAKDRTLCEDDDEEVEEEEECVGFDYEDKLDMQTTCWVRNDKLRVLYEIHRIDESYAKAVRGVSETPREREFRLQGRRKQALDDKFVPTKYSH